MTGTLLRGWLSRNNERAAARPQRAVRQRRSTVLALEPLEDRCVPAAIRNLPGFMTNSLPANDDNSTSAINVGFQMNFFGTVADQVFVNNNGNVTFTQALFDYVPSDLNSDNGGIPIIAPFFADVDTRGSGSNIVRFGTDTLCGRPVFGVNYINVGYFNSQSSPLNSFQVILVDRSDTGAGNFDIEFNYDQILWELGSASSGVSASVGYSNGSGAAGTFFELPGSRVNGAFLDGGPQALVSQTLLSTTPGRLHFLVRNGQVIQNVAPMASSIDVTNQVRIFNPFRYIADLGSGTLRGNLTIVNVNPPVPATPTGDVNACLDIVATGAPPPNTTQTIVGPFAVIVSPGNVQVVNNTGTTGSGRPVVVSTVAALPPVQTPLRVPIVVSNTGDLAPNTFYVGGFPTQVLAGPFDLTAV